MVMQLLAVVAVVEGYVGLLMLLLFQQYELRSRIKQQICQHKQLKCVDCGLIVHQGKTV